MTRIILLVLLVLSVVLSAEAANKAPARRCAAARPAAAVVAAPASLPRHVRDPYLGAVTLDANTGKTLFADNENAEAYPASVTKLMTLLLVLEDVQRGRYALTTQVTATPAVACCEPSWIGLKAGDVITVQDLCTALMVESANDAAIALAVHASGSLAAFVERMNTRAAELGMTKTRYYNPNGLPPNAAKRYPWKSFNVSTAHDQALLARRLVVLPSVLSFTSVKTCDLIKTPLGFRVSVTRRVNQPHSPSVLAADEKLVKQMNNHNNIMRTDKLKIVNADGYEAVDGLKTGFINAGGSSISLTGKRGKQRVIVVVLGAVNSKTRDATASRFLSDALGALAW